MLEVVFYRVVFLIEMKNKNVGFLIVGIAVLVGVIILLFNVGLKDIVVLVR